MPPQTNNLQTLPAKKKTNRHLAAWSLLLCLIAALFITGNRQAVYDWLRLQGYQPPADVAQIASDDELTASAHKVFLVNHPLVQSKADFAKSCPNGGKETAVLGCYIPLQRGIYVLNVTDPRLAGIEQVTAAHEMLHAAYDRLSSGKKVQVNGWLMDYYQHGLHDQTILDQVNSYKKTEPNDLVNEMHSIFGSEVAALPPDLENYYRQYFVDRQKITGFYATYEAEFTSRTEQIKQDDAQLASLKAQIQADEADLRTKQAELSSRQAQLDATRRSGNISAYNAGVPVYNGLVDAYNAEVGQVQGLVRDYNALVAARNAIALEEQQLTQDISSQVSPISNQ